MIANHMVIVIDDETVCVVNFLLGLWDPVL